MRQLLRKIGLLAPFDDADIEQAKVDDLKIDHDTATARVLRSAELLQAAQDKLKASIKEARGSDRLAQLIHDMKSG